MTQRTCNMPGCKNSANASWGLVPICQVHRDEIAKETARYYDKRISYGQRKAYHKISRLIPWSQRNMGVRD